MRRATPRNKPGKPLARRATRVRRWRPATRPTYNARHSVYVLTQGDLRCYGLYGCFAGLGCSSGWPRAAESGRRAGASGSGRPADDEHRGGGAQGFSGEKSAGLATGRSRSAGRWWFACNWPRPSDADGSAAGERVLPGGEHPAAGRCQSPRRFRLEPVAEPDAARTGCSSRPSATNRSALWESQKPVLVYNHGVITNEALPVKDDAPQPGLLRASALRAARRGAHRELPQGPLPSPRDLLGLAARPDRRQGIRPVDVQGHPAEVRPLARPRRPGPEAAVLGVENGWFVGDKKVMIERVWLRAYQRPGRTPGAGRLVWFSRRRSRSPCGRAGTRATAA